MPSLEPPRNLSVSDFQCSQETDSSAGPAMFLDQLQVKTSSARPPERRLVWQCPARRPGAAVLSSLPLCSE